MRKLIAIITILASLAAPMLAQAHRPGVKAETEAMVYQASSYYYGGIPGNEPRSAPLGCFKADISTVVKGSQWGAYTFSAYAQRHLLQYHTGNGYSIAHKIGSHWYLLWSSDVVYPPRHNVKNGKITYQGVPRRIAKDLTAGLGLGNLISPRF